MKKARPVIMSIVTVVMLLIPLAASATLTSSYTVAWGGSTPGGQCNTLGDQTYVTAIVQTYIDGNIGAATYRVLVPTYGGLLIAQANNPTPRPGTHSLEVYSTHEECPVESGSGKTTYYTSKKLDFTTAGLAAVNTKLNTAHAKVAGTFEIDANQYGHYTYRDFQAIADGKVIADEALANSFLRAAVEIQQLYFQEGDVGPGWWISIDGKEAIVGTLRADGSTAAYKISAVVTEDGYSWTSPVAFER